MVKHVHERVRLDILGDVADVELSFRLIMRHQVGIGRICLLVLVENLTR